MADLRTDEPILIRSAALAIVHAVSLFLVAHGVFTKDQASSLVQFVVPMVAAVLTMLVGVLMRQKVRPVAKEAADVDKKTAAVDAAFGQLNDLVSAKPAPAPVAASEPAPAVPAPTPPAAPVASAQ